VSIEEEELGLLYTHKSRTCFSSLPPIIYC